jgi:hypothetical protein
VTGLAAGWVRRLLAGAIALSCAVRAGEAQRTPADSARCDSIVASARVDSVRVGLFISVARAGGGELASRDAAVIAQAVGVAFIPPNPFRLSVFSGPARTRLLRPMVSDSAAELRPPTLTGVYRFTVARRGLPTNVQTIRASLMPGFDSAARLAIAAAVDAHTVLPSSDEDSMRVQVRFSSDSSIGAYRLLSADFPRLPVVDAVPKRENPPPVFPEDEKGDSTVTGEVVFRFVVDRDGLPAMETVELVRATSFSFAAAAFAALPKQLFAPATIRGCSVAQRVDYPFTFAAPPNIP